MGEDTHTGHQRSVEGFLLCLGQSQAGIDDPKLGAHVCRLPAHRCRLLHLSYGDAAEGREHPRHGLPLQLEIGQLLGGIQPFGLHAEVVALCCRALAEHRLELLLVAAQQLLPVVVQPYLFVEQQQGEVHLVHALAYLVDADVVLCLVDVGLPPCHLLVAADGTAVEECLLHVDADAVLVFLQSLHVDAHLPVQLLHLLGEGRHVALPGGLCRCRQLREPALLDVLNGAVGGLAYQVHLPDERVVAHCCLLTLLKGLCLHARQRCHRH